MMRHERLAGGGWDLVEIAVAEPGAYPGECGAERAEWGGKVS